MFSNYDDEEDFAACLGIPQTESSSNYSNKAAQTKSPPIYSDMAAQIIAATLKKRLSWTVYSNLRNQLIDQVLPFELSRVLSTLQKRASHSSSTISMLNSTILIHYSRYAGWLQFFLENGVRITKLIRDYIYTIIFSNMKECSDFYNEHRSILKKININPEKVRRYQQAILYYSAKKVRSDGGFPTDTNTLNADFANNETITKHKISDAAIWF